MQLRTAERRQARMRLALQGVSGAGKTFSSLIIARGMTDSWSKIALIDTEHGSADLYAHLGAYRVLSLSPPYSPERYIQAIEVCETAGVEVIIIDSISHCWDYLLDFHAKLQGNSFTNWARVTPRQRAFVDKMLQSSCHIIATMRVKQDYVLSEKNGKQVPEKVGLKAIQRDGVDYEFTIVLDMDLNHHCKASKDRTGLFIGRPEFLVTMDTGHRIRDWCEKGVGPDQVKEMIEQCTSLDELKRIYRDYQQFYDILAPYFTKRKEEIATTISQPSKHNLNGTDQRPTA
jgi:hypothetical protein